MAAAGYNILFPVDFSERSIVAAQCVKRWVDQFCATLNVLHVVDDEYWNRPFAVRDESSLEDLNSLIAKRRSDLRYFCDRYFGENVAQPSVLTGSPAEEIEHFAKRRNIDLIMLPRNHQRLVDRMMRDSLVGKLLERSAASLWTTEDLEGECSPIVKSILCPVHLDRDLALDALNERILQAVLILARIFHAKVAFLSVHDNDSLFTSIDDPTPWTNEPWPARARLLLGPSASFHQRGGDVYAAIHEAADEVSADLIVLGRTRPGTVGLGIQNHVLKINHETRRPIFSVW